MTISFSNQLVAEMYKRFWAARQAGEFLTDASAVAVPTAIAGWLGCVSPVVSARAVAGICKVGARCSTTSPDTLADVASHHAPPVVNVRLADPLRGLAGTLRRAPCLGSSGPSVRRASTIDGREPSTIDGREQITSLIGPRVP